MWLLLNVSSYDERWEKALEAAKKYDCVVIDSKNLIFVVVDKLTKLIVEECTEYEHVEVNISDISFTIGVGETCIIKYEMLKVKGELSPAELYGQLELCEGDEVIDPELRVEEIDKIIEGKGKKMITELLEVEKWVDSVSERMEEDPELVARVKSGLSMIKVSLCHLIGKTDFC